MKTNHSLHAILLLLLGLLTVLLTASPGTAAAPAVLCVRVDGKSNTIAVSYSEPVSLGGVYTLDGGASIGGRRYGVNTSEVVLATSPLTPEMSYTLTVSDVRHRNQQSIRISPNPTTWTVANSAVCGELSSRRGPDGSMVLMWERTSEVLQSSTDLLSWTDVPGARSPHTVTSAVDAVRTFRLRLPTPGVVRRGPDLMIADLRVAEGGTIGTGLSFEYALTNAGNYQASGFTVVGAWLSQATTPPFNRASDVVVATHTPTLDPPLLPGQVRWFRFPSASIPNTARFGRQKLAVCVDVGLTADRGWIPEINETNNCVVRNFIVLGGDLVISSLSAQPSVAPFQPIRGSITISNRGNGLVTGRVNVGFGLSLDPFPQNGNDIPLYVPPFNLNLQPGTSQTFSFQTGPIGAALFGQQYLIAGVDIDNRVRELDERNNLGIDPIQVVAPFWDLQFEIVNAPSVGYACGVVSWGVKITNAGNVPSDDVCFISGIGAHAGPGNWADNLGLFFGKSGVIAAGDSRTIDVPNYQVWCNAWRQTQRIKAEIHYSARCFDNFTAGNYAERPIAIR